MKWGTRINVNYIDGISSDFDMELNRQMIVTHFRRAHGHSDMCTHHPKDWFGLSKSTLLKIPQEQFTEEYARRECRNVPRVMYIVTKKRHLKYISEYGCVVSERTYPVSDNLTFDPVDMKSPILLLSTPPWDARIHISAGGYLNIDMDGFCYMAIDTEALFFDGWRFSLFDDGIWRL